jgi:hypothetical protein
MKDLALRLWRSLAFRGALLLAMAAASPIGCVYVRPLMPRGAKWRQLLFSYLVGLPIPTPLQCATAVAIVLLSIVGLRMVFAAIEANRKAL